MLVLGAAYKDVDDIRESPAVKIITLLKEKGAQVIYHDPYIANKGDENEALGLIMKAVELEVETLQGVDCVLLVTDHSCYDYGWILDNSTLIVDTRNAFKDYRSLKIYKA